MSTSHHGTLRAYLFTMMMLRYSESINLCVLISDPHAKVLSGREGIVQCSHTEIEMVLTSEESVQRRWN